MSTASVTSIPLRPTAGFLPALWRPFQRWEIVLPFAAVIAIWWAAKLVLGLDDKILASPP